MVTGGLALIIGRASSFGPTSLLASAATVVGLVLFAAGSWRTGVLSRWMLGAWIVAWLVGGPFAQGATPYSWQPVYAASPCSCNGMLTDSARLPRGFSEPDPFTTHEPKTRTRFTKFPGPRILAVGGLTSSSREKAPQQPPAEVHGLGRHRSFCAPDASFTKT